MPLDNYFNKYADPSGSVHEAGKTSLCKMEMANRCEPTQINCETPLEVLAALSFVKPKRRSLLQRLFSNTPMSTPTIKVPANRLSNPTDTLNPHVIMTPPSRRTTLPPPYVAAAPFSRAELDLE
jgi:hypothetical protein